MRDNLLDMTYRLDDHKTAIIHIRTVGDFEEKGKQSKAMQKVSLEQHEEIMGNI